MTCLLWMWWVKILISCPLLELFVIFERQIFLVQEFYVIKICLQLMTREPTNTPILVSFIHFKVFINVIAHCILLFFIGLRWLLLLLLALVVVIIRLLLCLLDSKGTLASALCPLNRVFTLFHENVAALSTAAMTTALFSNISQAVSPSTDDAEAPLGTSMADNLLVLRRHRLVVRV